MKTISLTKGKVALIDDEDFAQVSAFRWCASANRSGQRWYALTRIRGTGQPGVKMYLHRFIANAKPSEYVDHVNGNGLDCRRKNLRTCTMSENGRNRGRQRNNTSGFKGVSHWTDGRRWQAAIKLHGKRIPLGLFNTAIDAAKAYDEAAIRLHGAFARRNFQ